VCCWLIIDVGRVAAANGINHPRASQGRAPLLHPGFTGWGWMLSLVLLGMAVGPVAGTVLADGVLGNTTHRMPDLSATSTRVTLLLTVLASIVSVVSLSTLERLSSARATADAAQRAAAENQVRLLELQLEPHMLFNMLANLRVLIAMDPARTQLMLDRLIGFLRATLGASRVALHPLEAEFARLGDCLGLMQVRMDHRLETHFELPAELAACQVPPLLLQPLVENAIKHGLEPKVEWGRCPSARRAKVRNSYCVCATPGSGSTAALRHRPPAAGSSFRKCAPGWPRCAGTRRRCIFPRRQTDAAERWPRSACRCVTDSRPDTCTQPVRDPCDLGPSPFET